MNKLISVIALSAAVTLFFAGCDNTVKEEETTDSNEEFIEIIDKSRPVTSGNLITKTNTDDDGNVNVSYYDNSSKLVEQYVWNGDDNLSHVVMTYNSNTLLSSKEEISPDGQSNVVYNYQYDDNDKLSKTSISSFSGGYIEKTVTYDSGSNITGTTLYTYGEKNEVKKIERFNGNDNIIDYIIYDYSESGLRTKATEFNADGKMREFTVLEYDDGALLSKESRYNEDADLTGYNTYDYYEDGRIKASKQFDSNGKLLSSSEFD